MKTAHAVTFAIIALISSAFTWSINGDYGVGSTNSERTTSSMMDTIPLGEDAVIYAADYLNPEVVNYFESQGVHIDSCSDPRLYLTAFDWLGTPYHYGGSSKSGVDCSSFVKKMYALSYSQELKGTSRSLYSQIEPVAQEELQEGDLVFFKIRGNTISHVGVYLKDGYFVHASTKRGVMVNNLNEKYYKQYYFEGGALRPAL